MNGLNETPFSLFQGNLCSNISTSDTTSIFNSYYLKIYFKYKTYEVTFTNLFDANTSDDRIEAIFI